MATTDQEKKPARGRNRYTFWLTFLVIFLLFLVDPDSGLIQNLPFGAGPIAVLVTNLKPVIAITLIHYTRKWIFDYVDLSMIYDDVMAGDNNIAKALFGLAMGLFTFAFSVVFAVSMI